MCCPRINERTTVLSCLNTGRLRSELEPSHEALEWRIMVRWTPTLSEMMSIGVEVPVALRNDTCRVGKRPRIPVSLIHEVFLIISGFIMKATSTT